MIFSVLIQGVSQKKKFCPLKRGGGGGGGHQKFCPLKRGVPDISKIIFQIYQKIFHNIIIFAKYKKFFTPYQNFPEIFMFCPNFTLINCCPTVKISGGTCQFSSRPSWESPLATSIGKSPSNGQYMG